MLLNYYTTTTILMKILTVYAHADCSTVRGHLRKHEVSNYFCCQLLATNNNSPTDYEMCAFYYRDRIKTRSRDDVTDSVCDRSGPRVSRGKDLFVFIFFYESSRVRHWKRLKYRNGRILESV